MFRNILIPVDFGESSRQLLDRVGEFVEPGAGCVQLLHVIETIEHLSEDDTREFYGMLEAKAHTKLDELVGKLDLEDIEVRRHVIFGKRAPKIVEFARENACDLVLLTTHTISTQEDRGRIGTISHQVALMSPCAVLLLR
jgi:nucleotide-binding universal stress UspA family protein